MICMLILVMALGSGAQDGEPEDGFQVFDAGSGVTADQLFTKYGVLADSVFDIDPGILPEGDYLMDMAFTNDGSKVLVCNYMTENVTVIDRATLSIDT
ncbi:MAG: hypothetical protein GF388_12185, partial [Candidatus Aegiribacteria sp.]|nr:hypothetical protein [Candidatus Aegiribacteria sp.]